MIRFVRGALVLVAAGALALAWPAAASAQKKAKPAAAKAAKPAKPAKGAKAAPAADAPAGGQKDPEARVERTERGGKVIKLSPIIVEGKVQKPLALVLARSSIQYDWEQLKKDFTPKIVEAVSKSPF
jgi:hypothetical protein